MSYMYRNVSVIWHSTIEQVFHIEWEFINSSFSQTFFTNRTFTRLKVLRTSLHHTGLVINMVQTLILWGRLCDNHFNTTINMKIHLSCSRYKHDTTRWRILWSHKLVLITWYIGTNTSSCFRHCASRCFLP